MWELVAHALAQLLHTIVLATAPRRILMGGGVVEGRPELLGSVRRQLVESLNGYLKLDELPGGIEGYATAASINKGESVGLKVNSADGSTFRVEVYRTGYYGGAGARLFSVITAGP